MMAYQMNPHTSGAATQAMFEIRPARSVHHVRPGENLGQIAKMHGTSTAALIKLNSHQLGSNGAGFQPGMRLEI
jgi:hypothetical protein